MAELEKTKVESKEEEAGVCVCISSQCYKINCKSRSNPREYCPELSGPVDWRGRPYNEQRKNFK